MSLEYLCNKPCHHSFSALERVLKEHESGGCLLLFMGLNEEHKPVNAHSSSPQTSAANDWYKTYPIRLMSSFGDNATTGFYLTRFIMCFFKDMSVFCGFLFPVIGMPINIPGIPFNICQTCFPKLRKTGANRNHRLRCICKKEQV